MKKLFIAPAAIFIVLFLASFENPTQLFKTSLKITIVNDLGNPVDSAEVTLYPTLEDYRNNENPAQETQYTNSKGEVRFKDLEPVVYFVDARKEALNNDGGGVETQQLEKGKVNRVTIVVR